MLKIPVSPKVRKKIVGWLKEKVKYDDIIELVKKEGESISKGGINYIKEQDLTEPTEQKTEKQARKKKAQDKKPQFENALEVYENQKKKKSKPIKKELTVNEIFEKVIEFCENKTSKGYVRIKKILKSHDKNRNYQSNILRDLIEILIEMRLIK